MDQCAQTTGDMTCHVQTLCLTTLGCRSVGRGGDNRGWGGPLTVSPSRLAQMSYLLTSVNADSRKRSPKTASIRSQD